MDVSETSHLPSSQGSYHPKERTGGSIGSDDPKEENVGERQLLPAKSLSTSPDPLHGPTGSSSAIVAAVPGCVIVGSSSHQSDNATTAPALASPPRNPDCVERTDVTTVLPSPEIPVQLGIQPPLSSTKSTTVPGKPRSLGKHKKPPSTKSITVTLTSPQRSTVSPSLCHLDLFEPLIPTPTCLMYVPVQLHGVDFRALIDSGASDNFISSGICDHLRLSRHPLKEPLTMQLADGSYTSVGSYTRPHLKIGELKLRMVLKIVETPLPLILGFSFLQFFNPRINWKTRELEIEYGGESFLIQAFPSLLSFKQSSGKLTPAQVIQLLQAAPAQQIQLSAAQFPVSDFEVLCKASENPTAAAKVFSLTTTEPISSDSDSSNHPQKMRKKDNPSSDGDGPDTSPEEVELSNNDKLELFYQFDHHRISRKA